MTTIRNTFHGTTARTTMTPGDLAAARTRVMYHEADDAEVARVRRIDRKLCGCRGCECGYGFEVIEA